MGLAVIVLAAGEGTRMKSSRPKVLHSICGKPMIHYVLKAAESLHPDSVVIVVGHKAQMVQDELPDLQYVVQEKQLGTGHAVSMTSEALESYNGPVLVLSGDTPLVTVDTLTSLYETHIQGSAAATILTAKVADPTGYGRIVRGPAENVVAIIEQKDATEEQRLIAEVNSGTYCFDKNKLFKALTQVDSKNVQREYYLTDVIGILTKSKETVLACRAEDTTEILGVNSRAQLAEADAIMRQRINHKHMLNGVTIIDPQTTYIAPDIEIGQDTILYPMTILLGETRIGENCSIGPATRIISSKIEAAVTVENSVVRDSIIEEGAACGPYCHIRPGTVVKAGAKVGGFVEIKKSEIGPNSKVPHLSYIGDAIIGEEVNVGAGSITCNYDGANKYQTVIEDGAFIGSDTMLVAPVRIGKGAFTGAGSVITKDVPPESLSVERSEQQIVEKWAKKRRKKTDVGPE